jgi:hypothetical protein
MANNPPTVTFIDNPHAPEVFAAEAVGLFLHLGNIHITFAGPRSDYGATPAPINRVVMGRLVMPLAGANSLRQLLADFLDRMKAQATAQAADAMTPPKTAKPKPAKPADN